MAQAIALGHAARGRTAPNPNVGCVIVMDGEVIGCGATAVGGRPHAEAVALYEADDRARGATLYTSLEPCAHVSPRGPTCLTLIGDAGVARLDRVAGGVGDADPDHLGVGRQVLGQVALQGPSGHPTGRFVVQLTVPTAVPAVHEAVEEPALRSDRRACPLLPDAPYLDAHG